MKTISKILAISIISVLFTACGGGSADSNTNEESTIAAENQTNSEDYAKESNTSEEVADESQKVIVVIVDEDGEEVTLSEDLNLSWRVFDSNDNELEDPTCSNDDCSTWEITISPDQELDIELAVYEPTEEDELCSVESTGYVTYYPEGLNVVSITLVEGEYLVCQ